MWPLVPSQIPGPGQGIDLVDIPMMIGWFVLGAIVVFGGFAFLLVRMTRGRREAWVVHCPSMRTRAVVVVHRREDGVADRVVYCSRWSIGRDTTCDRACLRRAA